MEKECKYVKEIRKRQKIQSILILIFLVIILANSIPWNMVSGIFNDSNGKFSNEILWTSIGSIGSISAFIGVIITIVHTEKSRIKQNQYEYYKKQKEDELTELSREVKKQLDILNPTNAIEISMILIDDDNYVDIIDKFNLYLCKIKNIYWNIHWYYADSDDNENNMVKYKEFMRLLDEEITIITNIITQYTNLIVNWFSNKKIYMSLEKMKSYGTLNEKDQEKLNKLKETYSDIQKQTEMINTMGKYKLNLMNESTKKMPIIEMKAKEMIQEKSISIKNKISELNLK